MIEYSIEKSIYRLSWYEIFDYWPIFGGAFTQHAVLPSGTSYFLSLLRCEEVICETTQEDQIITSLLKVIG